MTSEIAYMSIVRCLTFFCRMIVEQPLSSATASNHQQNPANPVTKIGPVGHPSPVYMVPEMNGSRANLRAISL